MITVKFNQDGKNLDEVFDITTERGNELKHKLAETLAHVTMGKIEVRHPLETLELVFNACQPTTVEEIVSLTYAFGRSYDKVEQLTEPMGRIAALLKNLQK